MDEKKSTDNLSNQDAAADIQRVFTRYRQWAQRRRSVPTHIRLASADRFQSGIDRKSVGERPGQGLALTTGHTRTLVNHMRQGIGTGALRQTPVDLRTPAMLTQLAGTITARYQTSRPDPARYRPQPAAPDPASGVELFLASGPPPVSPQIGQETPGFRVGSIIPPMPKKKQPSRPASAPSDLPANLPAGAKQAAQAAFQQRQQRVEPQPSPPPLRPKSRVFSRIEEVSSSQKPALASEPPAELLKPLPPPESVPVEEADGKAADGNLETGLEESVPPSEAVADSEPVTEVSSDRPKVEPTRTKTPVSSGELPLRSGKPAQSAPAAPPEPGKPPVRPTPPVSGETGQRVQRKAKAAVESSPLKEPAGDVVEESVDEGVKPPRPEATEVAPAPSAALPKVEPGAGDAPAESPELPLRQAQPPVDLTPPASVETGERVQRKEKAAVESVEEAEKPPRPEAADVAPESPSTVPKVEPGAGDAPAESPELPLRQAQPPVDLTPPASVETGERVQRKEKASVESVEEGEKPSRPEATEVRTESPSTVPKVEPGGGEAPAEALELPLRQVQPPVGPTPPAAVETGERVQRKEKAPVELVDEAEKPSRPEAADEVAPEPPSTVPKVEPGVGEPPAEAMELPLHQVQPPVDPATPPAAAETGERVQRKEKTVEEPVDEGEKPSRPEAAEVATEPPSALPKVEPGGGEPPAEALELPLHQVQPPVGPTIPPAAIETGERVQRKEKAPEKAVVESLEEGEKPPRPEDAEVATEPPSTVPSVKPGAGEPPAEALEMPLRQAQPPVSPTPPAAVEKGERVQQRKGKAPEGPTPPLEQALRRRAATLTQLPLSLAQPLKTGRHRAQESQPTFLAMAGFRFRRNEGIGTISSAGPVQILRRKLTPLRRQVKDKLPGTKTTPEAKPVASTAPVGGRLLLRQTHHPSLPAWPQVSSGITPDMSQGSTLRRQLDQGQAAGQGQSPLEQMLPAGLAQLGQIGAVKVVRPGEESATGTGQSGSAQTGQSISDISLGKPKVNVVKAAAGTASGQPALPLELAKPPVPVPVMGQASASGTSQQSSAEAPRVVEKSPDLNRLALSVYPLVKRLLALERERRPGW